MGQTISQALPLLLDDPEMRMASRDLCDDETWSNTVRNRSTTSVQQRLHLLSQEPSTLPPLGRASRRLAFAAVDSVRLYVPDRREHEPLLPAWPLDSASASECEEEQESEESDGSCDEDDLDDALRCAAADSFDWDPKPVHVPAPVLVRRATPPSVDQSSSVFGLADCPVDVHERLACQSGFDVW